MFKVFYDLTMLAMEAQQAIWWRSIRLWTGGPAAEREAERMVSEKIAAAQGAALKLMTGGSPGGIVKDYRRKVRSNVRRLSKF